MTRTFSFLLFCFVATCHFAQDKCKVLRLKADQNEMGASSNNECCKDSALIANAALLSANKTEITKIHAPFGVPKATSKNVVVLYGSSYITGYDTVHKIPMWVQYKLQTKAEQEATPKINRTNCFRYDPRIASNYQASYNDYAQEKLDTFQRGHLKPSADSYRSLNDNLNSFVMTNMAPQHQTLNMCEWEVLEEFIRNHSLQSDIQEAYIISGSEVSNSSPKLNGKAVIADAFYKIYFFKKGEKWYYWTFYLKHDSVLAEYDQFVTDLRTKQKTIDQLEKQNNTDFFVCDRDKETITESKVDKAIDLNLMGKYNSLFCNKFVQK